MKEKRKKRKKHMMRLLLILLFVAWVNAAFRSSTELAISEATLLLPPNLHDRVQYELEGYNGCFSW